MSKNFVDYDNAEALVRKIAGNKPHEILNSSGTSMAQEDKLQFTGGLSVTDDSTNGKTVVSGDYPVYQWEDWNALTEQQQDAIPNAQILNAPSPSGDGVQTFAIPTSAWVANTGSDASEFPYVVRSQMILVRQNFFCWVLIQMPT